MVIHMTRQQLYTRGGILDELMDTGFSAAGLVDAAGRLIRYSVPTLRDLGKTQEECVGRPIEELDPDTHLGQVAPGCLRRGGWCSCGGNTTSSRSFPSTRAQIASEAWACW